MVSSEHRSNPRRIVLVVGPTDSGKTTLVNALSRQQRPLVNSSTIEVVQSLPQFEICLVDTPGFGSNFRTDESIHNDIANWMTLNAEPGSVLAIIYVFSIANTANYQCVLSNFIKIRELVIAEEIGTLAIVSNMWNLDNKRAAKFWGEKHQAAADTWLVGTKHFYYDGTIPTAKNILNSLMATGVRRTADTSSRATLGSNRDLTQTRERFLTTCVRDIERGVNVVANAKLYIEMGGDPAAIASDDLVAQLEIHELDDNEEEAFPDDGEEPSSTRQTPSYSQENGSSSREITNPSRANGPAWYAPIVQALGKDESQELIRWLVRGIFKEYVAGRAHARTMEELNTRARHRDQEATRALQSQQEGTNSQYWSDMWVTMKEGIQTFGPSVASFAGAALNKS